MTADTAIPDTGLKLMSFYPADNKTTLLEGKRTRFLFDVANTSTKNVARPQIKIELYTVTGALVTSSTQELGAIPAQQAMMNAYFDLEIQRRGGYVLKATILSPAEFTDPNMADNSREINLIVTYNGEGENFCTHFLGGEDGKYPDGTELTVEIARNVDSLSPQEITTAASYWHGLSPNISFKSVQVGTDLGRTVQIVQETKNSDNELIIAQASSTPFPNGPYEKGKMVIFSNMMNKFVDKGGYTASERRIDCVSHEFGHILGLDHANCTTKSIMAANTTDANYSPTIEDHDIYNLSARYS